MKLKEIPWFWEDKNRTTSLRDKIAQETCYLLTQENFYEKIEEYLRRLKNRNFRIENIDQVNRIFKFINYRLKKKKLYISPPIMDLKDFCNLSLSEQFNQLLIDKEENILNSENNISWWNCHNWTIIYKEIFDYLWINNQIITFEPYSPHSVIIFELNWNYYISDVNKWEKFHFEKLESKKAFDIWSNYEAIFLSYSPPNFLILTDNSSISYKANTFCKEDFINYINSKKRENIFIAYHNKNRNEIVFFVRISRWKLKISIENISRKPIEISIDKMKIKDFIAENMTIYEIFEYIFQKTKNSNLLKNEVLKWLFSKVNKDVLLEIIKW